jgi:hypothetical protein
MEKIQQPVFNSSTKKKKGSKCRNKNFFEPADKRPECDQKKDNTDSRIHIYQVHSLIIPYTKKQEKDPHD